MYNGIDAFFERPYRIVRLFAIPLILPDLMERKSHRILMFLKKRQQIVEQAVKRYRRLIGIIASNCNANPLFDRIFQIIQRQIVSRTPVFHLFNRVVHLPSAVERNLKTNG